MPTTNRVIVGDGRFRYQALPKWEQLPAGWSFVEVVAVATDSQDRVYVYNRGEHPVIVFDKDGKFLKSWGERDFVRPHGIHIGPDDSVWCSDDRDHTVECKDAGMKSGVIHRGDTFSFSFDKPGKYHYKCRLHPRMKGEIDVEK